MIALTILAFGLLIIGAALPIGMQRTRDTAELAVADATLDYAFGMIESRVRLAKDASRDNLFRPRTAAGVVARDTAASAKRTYEPWIKVRPLLVAMIDVEQEGDYEAGEVIYDLPEVTELQVEAVFDGASTASGAFSDPVPYQYLTKDEWYSVSHPDRWLPTALSPLDCVYPSLDLDAHKDGASYRRFTPDVFFDDMYDRCEVRWPVGSGDEDGSETDRARDRRVSWVVFYRRAAYATVDPSAPAQVLETEDPLLYEFITFVVQRPTLNHRFPLPSPDDPGWKTYEPVFAEEDATLVPVPVLVTFDEFEWLEDSGSPPDYDSSEPARPLDSQFTDRGSLTFRCSGEVGRMLPKGSVIVPATNDDALAPFTGAPMARRISGFVPHTPNSLPLYTVTDRVALDDDEYDIIVANNGYYPWVLESVSDKPAHWPFWIIPPAFAERDSDDQPVFDGRSPIIAVDRRIIRLSEVE